MRRTVIGVILTIALLAPATVLAAPTHHGGPVSFWDSLLRWAASVVTGGTDATQAGGSRQDASSTIDPYGG